MLHHSDAAKALKKLVPLLRSGGLFIVQEFVPGTLSFWAKGKYCENLALLELEAAKAVGKHSVGAEKASQYMPSPLYRNLLK